MPKRSPSSDVGDYRPISIILFLSNVLKKIVALKLIHFLESNILFPHSQFLYCRGLETFDVLLTLSHRLQVALNKGIEERLVQVDFSAAFNGVSHCGLLYKLRSESVGGKFLFIVWEFLNDRRLRRRLCGKLSASVDVISEMPRGSVVGPLLFILYTSELSILLETILCSMRMILQSM